MSWGLGTLCEAEGYVLGPGFLHPRLQKQPFHVNTRAHSVLLSCEKGEASFYVFFFFFLWRSQQEVRISNDGKIQNDKWNKVGIESHPPDVACGRISGGCWPSYEQMCCKFTA